MAGRGQEGLGSVEKRDSEKQKKKWECWNDLFIINSSSTHMHRHSVRSLIARVISHFRQMTTTFVKCSELCECDRSLHGGSCAGACDTSQCCALCGSTLGAGLDDTVAISASIGQSQYSPKSMRKQWDANECKITCVDISCRYKLKL